MDQYIKKIICDVCQIPIGEEWQKESGDLYIMRYVNYAPYANNLICTRCQVIAEITKQKGGI
jgi:hypothetical protein